jgi:hypothetical protein
MTKSAKRPGDVLQARVSEKLEDFQQFFAQRTPAECERARTGADGRVTGAGENPPEG